MVTEPLHYPAQKHVNCVVERLYQTITSTSSHAQRLLYLEGEITRERHDTDGELPFHQESNFFYLTGYDSPGAILIILAESGTSYRCTLYIADVDQDAVVWSGLPPLPEEVRGTHDVDRVSTISHLQEDLDEIVSAGTTIIYTLPWTTTPVSRAKHSQIELIAALHSARMIKDEGEIELIRRACQVSSRAHEALMLNISRGQHLSSEAETEALFVQKCRSAGARHQAYLPICAFGTHASTLHYVKNDSQFSHSQEGSLILVDAGCEVNNYCADITRTIPVGNGGHFTIEGKNIYELVLDMQNAAFAQLKPGASWEDIHLSVHKVATRGLLKLGLIKAGPSNREGENLVHYLYEKCVSCAFFPHGLGHMLGLDVHDVGGLPHGRSTDPRLRYLRLRRPLQVGFVVTVEPGIYCNEFLVGRGCCGENNTPPPWSQYAEYIDYKIVDRYRYIGGVRIEDVVVITSTGYEVLSTAARSITDVERLCSGLFEVSR